MLKDLSLAFLRTMATLLDIAVALGALLGLGFVLYAMGPRLGPAASFVAILLLAVGWCLFEARDGRSPGKHVLGLRLVLPGDYRLRVVLLVWRNLIKGALIALLGSVAGGMSQSLSATPGPMSFATIALLHPMTWVPLTGIVSLLLYQRLIGTDRLPQDMLSGSRVELDEKSGPVSGAIGLGFGVLLLYAGGTWALYGFVWDHRPQPRVSHVKANMHTFQTIVETYAVDWNGIYPTDIEALRAEATRQGREYWKEIVNPFTGKYGPGGSYAPMRRGTGLAEAGQVLYDPVRSRKGKIESYYIYGLDKNGKLIQDKGKDFTLSNS